MLLKVGVRRCLFVQLLNVLKVSVHMHLSRHDRTEPVPSSSLPLSEFVLIILVRLTSEYVFEGHHVVLHAMISQLLNTIALF